MPRKVRLRYLKISAVHDSKGGLILFVLNRDLTYEMQLDVDARSFAGLALEFPGRVAFVRGYSEELAHWIEAGAERMRCSTIR